MALKKFAFIADEMVNFAQDWEEDTVYTDFPFFLVIPLDENSDPNITTGWAYIDGVFYPTRPVVITPPSPQEQIYQLENACNSQRLREHILGINTTWLPQNEAQIAALRAQIPAPAGKSSK